MTRSRLKGLSLRPLFAAAAFAFATAAPAPSAAQDVHYLSLQTGHSMVLRVQDLRRVAVGDADCVGVVAIGTSQLVVNGKQPGNTSLFVWSGGRRTAYEVIVTNQAVDGVADVIRTAIN